MLNDRCAQLLDALEPIVAEGGVILDWHSCEAYPERWADLVVVLTCDHSKLWERLEKRCVRFSSPAPLALYHHPSHSPRRPRTFPPIPLPAKHVPRAEYPPFEYSPHREFTVRVLGAEMRRSSVRGLHGPGESQE